MFAAPILAISAQLMLVADKIPQLNYQPSCRNAMQADVTSGPRNENACLQDEKTAKAKLRDEWGQFSADQKAHCLRLQNAGGMPSYVELLTCAEMGKAAKDMGSQKKSTPQPIGKAAVPAKPKRVETVGSRPSK